jgi:hypothetical protein
MNVLFDAATTAVESAGHVLSEVAEATGLSSVANAISDTISSLASARVDIPPIPIPFPNPLHSYATYDYILSIGILTVDQMNNPDTTFMAGQQIPLICKSANANPGNRIDIPYGSGKYDFFVDNLVLDSVIGHTEGVNTNVTTFTFDITEPYSMGLFAVACQTAASNAGWPNWREACFLLTIQFRGNKEAGQMTAIPGTTRYIPFRFVTQSMVVNAEGGKYHCELVAYSHEGITTRAANLKNDTSIGGTTVQEALQTGEKSLQAVFNKRLQQLKKDGLVEEPDEIVIIFPTNVGTNPSNISAPVESEDSSGATTRTIDTANPDVLQKLGVSRSAKNETLVQAIEQCNDMGKAKLGFSTDRRADVPFGQESKVWDPDKQVWVRINNSIDVSKSDFRFRQDTDIMNAINQVLLMSDFPEKSFDPARLTPEGYRQWWKIDVMTYVVSSDKNMKTTGKKPRLFVYRVIPYMVHVSSGPLPPNSKPPGYDKLYSQVIKHYNYIYTGKNTDVLNFQIKFENTFQTMMSADGVKGSMDIKTAAQNGTDVSTKSNTLKLTGNAPDKESTPTQTSYAGTSTPSDKLGGGGTENAATRAARLFHDTINNSQADMTELSLEILGDPYYITQSGTGNYTSMPTQYINLNLDGTANYQSGELDILVKFRTPIDIKQSTGVYDFSSQINSTPIMQYSGFYRVWGVTSTFKDGKFTQTLQGTRRILQESKMPENKNQTFSTSNFHITNEIGEFLDSAGKVVSDVFNDVTEFLGTDLVNDITEFAGDAATFVETTGKDIGNMAANITRSITDK